MDGPEVQFEGARCQKKGSYDQDQGLKGLVFGSTGSNGWGGPKKHHGHTADSKWALHRVRYLSKQSLQRKHANTVSAKGRDTAAQQGAHLGG